MSPYTSLADGVNDLAGSVVDIHNDFVGTKSLLRDQQIAEIKLLLRASQETIYGEDMAAAVKLGG